MPNIDKITLKGTDYTIVDSAVPNWAKQSNKPTYNGGEINYTGSNGNVITANSTVNTSLAAIDSSLSNYLKYQLVSSLPAYPNSGTLYLIAE